MSSQIAAHWQGVAPNQVTPKKREEAKKIVYGIIYGMGAFSLAQMLEIDLKKASEFISSFLGKVNEIYIEN